MHQECLLTIRKRMISLAVSVPVLCIRTAIIYPSVECGTPFSVLSWPRVGVWLLIDVVCVWLLSSPNMLESSWYVVYDLWRR